MSKNNEPDIDGLLRGMRRSSDREEIATSDSLLASGGDASSLSVGAELVNREDGSQVVRVRKRKRRTAQPKKEEEARLRRRKAMVVFSVVVAIFVLAITVAFLLAYRNSSKFNAKVAQTIEASSGAKVELGTLGVSPRRVAVKKAALTWPEGCLESLILSEVEVQTHPLGFFGGDWRIEDFTAERAVLKARGGTMPKGDGSEPLRIIGDIFDAGKLDCQFGESGAFLRDAAVRLRTGNGISVDFEGGELQLGHWGPLGVGSGYFMDSEGGVEIRVSLQSGDDYDEVLEVEGKLANDFSAENQLSVTANLYPLEHLLGPELGGFLQGPFSTQLGVALLIPSKLKALRLDIPVNGQGLKISKFPFLDGLGKIVEDADLLEHEFSDEASMRFRSGPDGIRLENLSLSTHNNFLIKGNIIVSPSGELSGELRLGVSEGKERYFKRKNVMSMTRYGADGYLWMTVRLGGSLSAPEDNFKEQFDMARSNKDRASGRRVPDVPLSKDQQLEDAFESLLGN